MVACLALIAHWRGRADITHYVANRFRHASSVCAHNVIRHALRTRKRVAAQVTQLRTRRCAEAWDECAVEGVQAAGTSEAVPGRCDTSCTGGVARDTLAAAQKEAGLACCARVAVLAD